MLFNSKKGSSQQKSYSRNPHTDKNRIVHPFTQEMRDYYDRLAEINSSQKEEKPLKKTQGRLHLTQYLWKISGQIEKLSEGIVQEDGDWKGIRYREGYFFEGTDKYYAEEGTDRKGVALMNMYKDNPAYLAALNLYHFKEQQSFNQIVGDVLLISGATITTILSMGSSIPIVIGLGVTSGTYGVGVGSAKLGFDLMEKPAVSAMIPSTPLGAIGKSIDEVLKKYYDVDNKLLSIELWGDVITGLIMIRYSGWVLSIEKVDRVITFEGIAESTLKAFGLWEKFDAEEKAKNIKQATITMEEIYQQYLKIYQANHSDE